MQNILKQTKLFSTLSPSSHPPVPSTLLDTHTHAWCFKHAFNLVLSVGHREVNEAAHGLTGLIQCGDVGSADGRRIPRASEWGAQGGSSE